MKILVLSTNGLIRDGITQWMKQYFTVTDQSGLEVGTVGRKEGDAALYREVSDAGIAVHILPPRRQVVAYVHALTKLLRDGHYDGVHIGANSATSSIELFAAWRAHGVKMRAIHSHNTTCDHKIIDKLLRPVMYRLSTEYLACGTDAGKWLFGSRPFHIVPNGQDPQEFAFDQAVRDKVRAELGLDDSQIAIGNVGGLNKQKNQSFLLDIFAAWRTTHEGILFVVGGGPKLDELKAHASELGISDSVRFLGPRNDVPNLLQAMDIMALPSLHEGFPIVALEWQLAGLPCVISDTITDECIITDLVTMVSLTASRETWVRALERGLNDSNREEDSSRARKSLIDAGYDVHKNAADLKKFYEARIES